MDDNITLNKTRIIEICKEITRRGLNIQWETPNGISLKNLDDDILGAMCSAGMVRTSLAIESGSEYIRNKVMGKSLSTEQIYKVVNLTKKYNALYVQAYFIIGMPEDTEETLQETYNLIDNINIDYPRPANIVPFPGTALFDQCYKDNLFTNTVDLKSLWKTKHSLFKTGTDFFVKPYNMTIERLREFREMLDKLVEKKMEEKHLDRLKQLSFVLPDYNPLG
jgi:magnesium-protoporphyrin IX monomethyl ester (oxidative) cyclase